MIRTRNCLVFACSAFLLACGGGEPDLEEMPPAAAPVTPVEEASPLGAFAGTWSVRVMDAATGDSLASYELMANAEPTGWTMTFPGREPIPITVVEAAGDSVVTEAGPFESVLRPGVQVSVRSVSRIQGDRLVATFVARYATAGADSVLNGRSEGTRIR